MDPVRDLTIISEELRIKDIEFTEKALENLKKQTRRGGQSLEMKKLKEEEATVEKILAWLKDGKDVRKENWTPKEVSFPLIALPPTYSCMMNKSYKARYNPSSLNVSIIQRRDRTEMKPNSDTKNILLYLLFPILLRLAADSSGRLGRSHKSPLPPQR